jgi:hypothetical protein
MKASWRIDIDSLSFRPEGHEGACVVHRRALRTLMRRDPNAEEALAFFEARSPAFLAAAVAKIERAGLAPAANFHLTSRDLRRALHVATGAESAATILDTKIPRR